MCTYYTPLPLPKVRVCTCHVLYLFTVFERITKTSKTILLYMTCTLYKLYISYIVLLLAPIHFASIWKSPATPSAHIERSVSAERNVLVGQYWLAAALVPQQWCCVPPDHHGSLVLQSPENGDQSSEKVLIGIFTTCQSVWFLSWKLALNEPSECPYLGLIGMPFALQATLNPVYVGVEERNMRLIDPFTAEAALLKT